MFLNDLPLAFNLDSSTMIDILNASELHGYSRLVDMLVRPHRKFNQLLRGGIHVIDLQAMYKASMSPTLMSIAEPRNIADSASIADRVSVSNMFSYLLIYERTQKTRIYGALGQRLMSFYTRYLMGVVKRIANIDESQLYSWRWH